MPKTYLRELLEIAAGLDLDSAGTLGMVAVFDLPWGSAESAFAPRLLDQGFAVVSVVPQRGREILCDGEISFW